MTDLVPGTILASQFRIVRRLGEGGMGAVFVADQLGMDRQVVVKVMHAELTSGQKAVERFKREARAVAALNHPNIVMVYSFGQADDGALFQAMELIDGRDLASEIRRSPLPEARALAVVDQVLEALIEAHSRGIVHRDLKPENIMLTARYGNPDHVKVLDFGIAKVMDQDADTPALTKEGAVFGTPRYMAPEQVRGQPVDARTDLYPLGLVLYEMLTGEHPFGVKAPLDYMIAHASEPIEAPANVTRATAAVLDKALAKEPSERFQSAREMRDAVRAALAIDERAPVAAAASPTRAAAKRAWWPWLVVGLLVVGGGVGLALALGGKSTPPPVVAATTQEATESPIADPIEEPLPDQPRDDPPVDPPPDDPPPVEPPPDEPVPTSDLAAADDIEGFPNPIGTRVTANDTARITLSSELRPKALMDFYRAACASRGWKLEKFPNGLNVLDERSPFTSIYMNPLGDTVQIYLGRRVSDEPTP